MIQTTPEEIINAGTGKLWNMFQILIEEEDEQGRDLEELYKEEIKQIKNGENQIPIWYITNKWYEEIPESKKIKVKGHGKYNIIEFMEDKGKRETIMRSILMENLEEGGMTEGRN